MSFRLTLRRLLASQYRHLPRFRGEGRVAAFLQDRLTDYSVPEECRVVVQMRNGTRMQIDLRSAMERHVYWRADAEDATLRLLAGLLPDGGHVLDIGANIGFFTIPLAGLLRARGGKAYAIEPVPANFARLCDNLRLNSLDAVAEPFHLALGNTAGLAGITMDDTPAAQTGNALVSVVVQADGGDGLAASQAIEPWRASDPVRVATLDEWSALVRLPRCDLVKIDIEGGEYGVFQSGQNFLRQYQPLIFCELNHRRMKKCHWTEHDLVDLLRPLGYSMHHHHRGQLLPGCVGGKKTEDVFLIPQDRVGSVAAAVAGRRS